jgi:hypothetical protein
MNGFHDVLYLRMPSGPPTQGDIWTGLSWWADQASTCTGLIITPRCDFSHEKTPVVNYLPIVSVSEFLRTDGGFRLISRELKKVDEAIRNTAKDARVIPFIELGISIGEIAKIKRSEPTDSAASVAKLEKQLSTLLDQENRRKALDSAFGLNRLADNDLKNSISEKELTRFLNELVRNNVSDVHFMPPCPHLLSFSSVLLLRHVLTSPIKVLKTAGMCRTQEDWVAATNADPIAGYAQNSPLPERILRVKSPFLESMMARFAALYGRIGVRDPDADDLEGLIEESKRQCGY